MTTPFPSPKTSRPCAYYVLYIEIKLTRRLRAASYRNSIVTLLAPVITEANTIVGLNLYSVFTNSMFLSTNNLSIIYTFSR